MAGGEDARGLLDLIDRTNAAGGRMFGQSHSRGVANILSFKTRLPFDALPEWRAVRDLPLDLQRKQLLDPQVRSRLVAAARAGRYDRVARAAEPRQNVPFEKIKILDSVLPPHRSVADVAAERRCDAVEVMIDLALSSNFEQLFMQPITLDDRDIISMILKHPQSIMTFSDSGAHVSQIADSSIQTYLLAYWVRQEQVFTLEEAVRLITGAPAAAWGFEGRGLIRQGSIADLNVIDPNRITPDLPVVVADLPSGAQRLRQTATGIEATVIGGEVVFQGGQHTGKYPGRLLRGG
jgi:N-acyl-D-aspartate/D-glutamate deacylase